MTDSETKALEKLRYRLNLIIIALLCSTTLSPPVIFFLRGPGEIMWLVVFIGVSFLVSLLPKSFYDHFQWSQEVSLYKKLCVHHFKKFSTNGDFINKRIRKKYPNHRNVTSYSSLPAKLNETYTIERSHTVLFVFCLLTTVYAYRVGATGTVVILTIGNILFNYYPNLLQQYNRIRYKNAIQAKVKIN